MLRCPPFRHWLSQAIQEKAHPKMRRFRYLDGTSTFIYHHPMK